MILDFLPDSAAFRVSLSNAKDLAGNPIEIHNWVFITPGYELDQNCGILRITNNNIHQDGIIQSIYRGVEIESDGIINQFSNISFKASNSIQLENDFEIKTGGVLQAQIEPCIN